jgi:hypothetical protein
MEITLKYTSRVGRKHGLNDCPSFPRASIVSRVTSKKDDVTNKRLVLKADDPKTLDREGRREAERHGIPVIGTLGVLRDAATLELLDIRVAAERLQATSFYVAPEILAKLLKDFA